MPARTFRVVIHNTSNYLRLVKTFDHLCWGDWTPGGWEPKSAIEPGASAGFQGESGGPLSGTEGYVKYDVVGPDRHHGMIYVYWDNPFYGVTTFRVIKAADDVAPDCDYDPPEGGSGFSDSSQLDFNLVKTGFRYTDSGGVITDMTDFVNVAVGPASLIGLLGIVKDPELDFELVDSDQTTDFAPTGVMSMKLMVDATPTQWAGEWRQGSVRVQISRQGWNRLTATITDGSSNPPMSIIDTFSIGPDSIKENLGDHQQINTLIQDSSRDQSQNKLFEKAAHIVLAEATPSQDVPSTAARFTSVAAAGLHQEHQGVTGTIDERGSQRMGRDLTDIIADSRAVVHLTSGIVLSLYGVFEGGSQVSERLHFQQIDDGDLVTDVMLDPYYAIK